MEPHAVGFQRIPNGHIATPDLRGIFGQQALGLSPNPRVAAGGREHLGRQALANQLAANPNPRKILP